ncbi:MAG: hypothetical protein HY704_02750 [Gemmatimonadetes bacterium]|nr:hypothetical protein [Gemmatimonadota bacterium]
MKRLALLVAMVGLAALGCLEPTDAPDGPEPPGTGGGPAADAGIRVRQVESRYRVASGGRSGWFASGQRADLMLSGFGFNRTRGALFFNHPRSLASDGTRLLLSDGNNNRVLIWNRLPTGNAPPDLVLGQPEFSSNNSGTGLDQMNWPGQVSVTRAGRVVLADTYNERLLVWNRFPTRNGEPADLALQAPQLRWPWGVWSDGTRLVASATGGAAILFWKSFPTSGGQPPDFTISGDGIGTPRTITSDGTFLIVGDHNAYGDRQGNFFWKSFPSSGQQRFDFFASDPNGGWMQGDVSSDGKLVMLGRYLNIWNAFPQNESSRPDLIVNGYEFQGGDGKGAVIASGRVYIPLYNANKIVVYNQLPSRADLKPDFAIGSPDIDTNTLDTEFIITNPVPATSGSSLFVSSDFDRRLLVWTGLPDESGAHPNWVYDLSFPPWDNELYGSMLVLAGRDRVAVWKRLPLNGELPDLVFRDQIGSVRFQDLRGVALDDRYFYLADAQANRIYVWRGLPSQSSEPAFSLSVNRPLRLSSDGRYLAVTLTEDQTVLVYRVAELSPSARAYSVGGRGIFNLPQGAALARGHLFIANTNFNAVHIWRSVEDALAGKPADVLLGSNAGSGKPPQIGEATLFWPGAPAFDGSYLWLGEFKFSQRLLRFSVR